MNCKKFDPVDANWGIAGETVVRSYFRQQGYRVTVLPNGKYKDDLKFENDYEQFSVEVERVGPGRWFSDTPFRFNTINVPARRVVTDDRIFFTVSCDLHQAYIMFPGDLKCLKPVRESNRHVKDELMRKYPIERALLIDFREPLKHSIARMNTDRVLSIVNDATVSPMKKMSVLKGRDSMLDCPYGLHHEDWCQLIAFVDNKSGLSDLVSKPMHNRQRTIEFEGDAS